MADQSTSSNSSIDDNSHSLSPNQRSVEHLLSLTRHLPPKPYLRLWEACYFAIGSIQQPNSQTLRQMATECCVTLYQQLPTLVPWSKLTKAVLHYFTGGQSLPVSPMATTFEEQIKAESPSFKTPPKEQQSAPPAAPNAPVHHPVGKVFQAPPAVCKRLVF